MAIIQNAYNTKFVKEAGKKGTLLCCWWECKAILYFINKLNISLPDVQAIPYLSMCCREKETSD